MRRSCGAQVLSERFGNGIGACETGGWLFVLLMIPGTDSA